VVLFVVRLLFYARWWAWYGGNSWGPRFLVPVLPAFAPVIAAARIAHAHLRDEYALAG